MYTNYLFQNVRDLNINIIVSTPVSKRVRHIIIALSGYLSCFTTPSPMFANATLEVLIFIDKHITSIKKERIINQTIFNA